MERRKKKSRKQPETDAQFTVHTGYLFSRTKHQEKEKSKPPSLKVVTSFKHSWKLVKHLANISQMKPQMAFRLLPLEVTRCITRQDRLGLAVWHAHFSERLWHDVSTAASSHSVDCVSYFYFLGGCFNYSCHIEVKPEIWQMSNFIYQCLENTFTNKWVCVCVCGWHCGQRGVKYNTKNKEIYVW